MSETPLPDSLQLFHDLLWLFDEGSWLSLLAGGLILLFVSQQVVTGRRRAYQWGLRIGILSFICWYIRDLINYGLSDADQLVCTGFRALLVLLYGVSVTWLLLTVSDCVFGEVLGGISRRTSSLVNRAISGSRQQIRSREEARSKRKRQALWLQQTPERERVDREQAARDEHQRRVSSNAQQQRAEMRYEVELLYDRRRTALSEKFPEERFREYFDAWLADHVDVCVYQQRAGMLTNMIEDLLDVRDHENESLRSLEDIITCFDAEKRKLDNADLDDDTLEILHIQIDDERDQAFQQYFLSKRKGVTPK